MIKSRLLLLVIVILILMSSCAPAASNGNVPGSTSAQGGPSHLICYQAGKSIIDTRTIHGLGLDRVVYSGGWSSVSWVWDDEYGHHTLYQEGSLCEEIR